MRAALETFPPEKRKALLMNEARKAAVRQAFGEYNVLFFFTHGVADFANPPASGLEMAVAPGDAPEEARLTLAEIFDLRSQNTRLAVLAACETGVPSDLKTMDEVVSLPSGLMQAGVPGVIGSLWSVAESSTAILMSIFFEEWRTNGLTPPQALRRAQQRLRVEKFSHPFYWAAFTFTGL